ncbi:MAG: hypothetical protein CL825_00665 [Crocinitomicaceae bacterium]|nr:hypothetical protein [Crocinitomicaceae bacterium]
MAKQINLDKHIRRCIIIITACILFAMTAIGSVITYMSFYGESGPDLRAIHIEQHAQEGARLDSLISVLEEINSNLSTPESDK